MRAFVIGLVVVLVLAAVGAAYYFSREAPQLPPPPPPAEATVVPAPAGPVGPRFPVVSAPKEPALPTLKDSDAAIQEAIVSVVGSDAFHRLFHTDELIRRIVATIDNLPRKSFAQRLSPVKPVGGTLATTGQGDTLAIAPENALRYRLYMAVVDSIDPHKLVAVYTRFYPLFQQAYVELGYPAGYFNDRVIDVIDHLLATPQVQEPIKLTVPHVLYEYADPDLQARSAGQKVLLRIGAANAEKVKAKLTQIRRELVAAKP